MSQGRNALIVGSIAAVLAAAALWAGVGDRVMFWLEGETSSSETVELNSVDSLEQAVASGWLPESMPREVRSVTFSRERVAGYSWVMFRINSDQFESIAHRLDQRSVSRPIAPADQSSDVLLPGDLNLERSAGQYVEGYFCESGVYWHYRIAATGWSRIHNSLWQPGTCLEAPGDAELTAAREVGEL